MEDSHIREVKVSKEDFLERAYPSEYIKGQVLRGGGATIPVAVSLGNKREYRGKRKPKTSYKLFANCTIYYAKTTEERDKKTFIKCLERTGVPVLLFC